MLKHRRNVVLAALALAALAGCSASLEVGESSPPPAAASVAPVTTAVDVQITLFRYDPQTVTVSPGTVVLWTNKDNINHTVSSGTADKPGGPLNGNLPTKDSTYSYRFDTPGVYPYYCQYHNSMLGTVIVKQP